MISLLAFITISLVLAFLSFRFLIQRNKLNQLKKNNDKGERWATQKKPIIGGIGFYLIFVYSFIFYHVFISRSFIIYSEELTLFSICTLGFFSGLWDDLKGSTPRVKLLIQILIGILIIGTGNGITAFNSNWINIPVTIFWVIALMNSINMLDNMDAITATFSTIIIASLTAISYYLNPTLTLINYISIGVILSLLVFLKWNWNPSKMYMGDNGSQFLGAFISFLGISVLWNNNNINHPSGFPIHENIAIIIAFIATISDTATVTINRLRSGKSPFIGGRDHTTHHLSYLGLSERQVAYLFIGISILANCCAFYILCIEKDLTVLKSIIWLIFALAIFAGLYSTTIFAKQKK